MKFIETELKGIFLIEIEKYEDVRGFFARTFDKNEFKSNKMETKFTQFSISFNKKKGTIRGMHFQKRPYEEVKVIRCTKGKIFDVNIDLRPKSPTFKKWIGIELSDLDHKMLYIPKGFAHGFQTLKDNTEIFYQISRDYKPEYSDGVRWNDKTFGIKWPLKPTIMSKADKMFKLF